MGLSIWTIHKLKWFSSNTYVTQCYSLNCTCSHRFFFSHCNPCKVISTILSPFTTIPHLINSLLWGVCLPKLTGAGASAGWLTGCLDSSREGLLSNCGMRSEVTVHQSWNRKQITRQGQLSCIVAGLLLGQCSRFHHKVTLNLWTSSI